MIRCYAGPVQRYITLVAIACSSSSPSSPPPSSEPARPAAADARPAVDAGGASADAVRTKIDAAVAEVLAKTPAAAISVAVTRRGDTVLARGDGLADVDGKVAATADTVFRIGSITKQFTAVAILQLAAAKKLALDDELVRYLPDYPVRGRHITLRNLLTHTSGIADYEHKPWFEAHMAEHRPPAELVASFAADPFTFEPSTAWAYSNSGYFLLGEIVEKVANQSYADYIRDHVATAGIAYCPDEPTAGQARGYDVKDDKRVPTRPIHMAYAYAAGALCATAPGLAAWTRALAHGKVVDDASWRAMTTPVTLADGSHYKYGFGLFLGDISGHKMIFHSGGINGFVAWLGYFPDDDVAIAVLVNTEGSPADQLGETIARIILDAPAPPVVDLPIDPKQAAAAAGTYDVPAIGQRLAIEVDGAQLFLRAGDARVRLRRQQDGSFQIPEAELAVRFVPGGIEVTQAHMVFPGHRAK
jgi:CubicO group peptidase (beta-lactamase class C family)